MNTLAWFNSNHAWLLGSGFALILLLLLAFILVFEIWMFVDVVKNKKISPEEKAIWVVGMLLIHPFVAIAYYFISSSARQRPPKK